MGDGEAKLSGKCMDYTVMIFVLRDFMTIIITEGIANCWSMIYFEAAKTLQIPANPYWSKPIQSCD